MGETTGIAWTDHTFSPWWGCEKVSAGCTHCYADDFAKRVGHGKRLPTIWGANSERRLFGDAHWNEPRKWHKAAVKAGRFAKVFCSSMADVFEDRPDLIAPRTRLFNLIAETSFLTWQLLTKRPENIARMLHAHFSPPHFPLKNVWLGTTCENQEQAEKRLPHLLAVPAVVHFISAEPLLGPLDLSAWMPGRGVGWVIVGGESGPRARPFQLDWARDLVAMCETADVPCFVKQMGDAPFSADTRQRYRAHHAADPAEWPLALRVQQFPMDEVSQ